MQRSDGNNDVQTRIQHQISLTLALQVGLRNCVNRTALGNHTPPCFLRPSNKFHNTSPVRRRMDASLRIVVYLLCSYPHPELTYCVCSHCVL